jgi:hypothetical protein
VIKAGPSSWVPGNQEIAIPPGTRKKAGIHQKITRFQQEYGPSLIFGALVSQRRRKISNFKDQVTLLTVVIAPRRRGRCRTPSENSVGSEIFEWVAPPLLTRPLLLARPIHVHVHMPRAHVGLLTRSRRADAYSATSERCCGPHVTSVEQQMLRAEVALLTRSRRADADYSTPERDAKRTRRAGADYATSELDAKRARRADADYSTSELAAKRTGAPTRTKNNAPTQSRLCDLRARCDESAASRRGLCDLQTRCEESRRADADQT